MFLPGKALFGRCDCFGIRGYASKTVVDYRNIVVNKLRHIALLPDGCMPVEVGGTAANTNREPAGRSQQLPRLMLRV